MRTLKSRLAALEAARGPKEKAFRWRQGVPLVEALAEKGWTLADGPFRAIEYVTVERGPDGPVRTPDPIHDRDRHLLA